MEIYCMKIELEDLIKNSFVISINDKRLQFFYENWKKANLPSLPKHVNGIQLSHNNYVNKNMHVNLLCKTHVSVLSTHLMIVSMAQAMNLPYVCIFEDDAIGCINIKDKFQTVLNNIPDDTDILILGNIKLRGIKEVLKNLVVPLVVPKQTFGLQSYIIMQKNYDFFIKNIVADYCTGLTKYGQNVYLVKDILFCQYSLLPESNQKWNQNAIGFIHYSIKKEELQKKFKIN